MKSLIKGIGNEKETKIIQYAFEGSKNLTEKITLAKKKSKIISE